MGFLGALIIAIVFGWFIGSGLSDIGRGLSQIASAIKDKKQ